MPALYLNPISWKILKHNGHFRYISLVQKTIAKSALGYCSTAVKFLNYNIQDNYCQKSSDNYIVFHSNGIILMLDVLGFT